MHQNTHLKRHLKKRLSNGQNSDQNSDPKSDQKNEPKNDLDNRSNKHQAVQSNSVWKKISDTWEMFGPGIITGASDDDPSGIATYSQAGAGFGLATLWTAFLSFPLMTIIQEMCGRVGMVTGLGLTSVVKKHYPKWLIYIIGLVSVPAIILNIAADLAGMGAVSNMIFPVIPAWIFTVLSAIAIIFSVILFSYKRLETILKWLSMILFVYFVVPFMVKQDWAQVLKATFIPQIRFDKDFISIIVGILGTTISPYLFFWEASMEVEDRSEKLLKQNLSDGSTSVTTPIIPPNPLERRDAKNVKNAPVGLNTVSDKEMKEMRRDNNIGMLFSNITMYFIILTTGTILFSGGVTNIATVQDAASALKPLAGDFAYILFALGVVGTGFLAIPVLAGACGYIIAEMFDWKEGMNNKFREARGFYEVIGFSILIGLALNIFGIDPIKSLLWSAIVYGITAPILIAIIMHIANRADIMGKWKNGWISNILGVVTFVVMALAALSLLFLS